MDNLKTNKMEDKGINSILDFTDAEFSDIYSVELNTPTSELYEESSLPTV